MVGVGIGGDVRVRKTKFLFSLVIRPQTAASGSSHGVTAAAPSALLTTAVLRLRSEPNGWVGRGTKKIGK